MIEEISKDEMFWILSVFDPAPCRDHCYCVTLSPRIHMHIQDAEPWIELFPLH